MITETALATDDENPNGNDDGSGWHINAKGELVWNMVISEADLN
ncbi:MAG: hypothetical protein JWO92_2545 [Chitinophagaceae bacterium]|nr:hypothetical protein [Chitinophagaceae bacterium]